ncbi:hypothetical protein ECG_08430 [Echinococcus granulosus]|nr:hypothetical protein ECG_08430 [Echinococcus granulosus]
MGTNKIALNSTSPLNLRHVASRQIFLTWLGLVSIYGYTIQFALPLTRSSGFLSDSTEYTVTNEEGVTTDYTRGVVRFDPRLQAQGPYYPTGVSCYESSDDYRSRQRGTE